MKISLTIEMDATPDQDDSSPAAREASAVALCRTIVAAVPADVTIVAAAAWVDGDRPLTVPTDR